MSEFKDTLNIVTQQLDLKLNQKDICDIAESLDLNKDGFIDFNEFLEAFRIVDKAGKDKTLFLKPKPVDNDEPREFNVMNDTSL